MRCIRCLASLLLVLSCPMAFAQESARITQFSPQGTVQKVRQARAAFSEAMVAFGDPRAAADPFSVECAVAGRGRWVDPRVWVYDFERDLPAGVRCAFRLAPGLRTLAGKTIGGPQEFGFSTGGPAVMSSLPYEGSRGISEDQVFILTLNAAPDEGSVLAHAGFAVPGIRERVGVRIITGEEREALLGSQPWLLRQQPDRSRLLLIQCRQSLPVRAAVSLVWGKGIRSGSGVATAQDQLLSFETRDVFAATFHCERENPRAGCMPVLPMSLRFNAGLDAGRSVEAVLKGPGGRIWKAQLPPGEGSITFPGPFPEKAEFQLEIPGDIRDDAGRALVNADKFPLKVRTAGYPPLAKFAARFGIIELAAEPALPVTLRNLGPAEKGRPQKADGGGAGAGATVTGRIMHIAADRIEELQPWLRKVAAASREKSVFAGGGPVQTLSVPKPNGAGAFEVVGIPLPKPGLYIVELESAALGKALLDRPRPMYVPAAALVTNLAVHLKQGRESSLVWVTTLDRAQPVPEASISVMTCEGKPVWSGRTDGIGVARIDRPLPAESELPSCSYETDFTDYPQMGGLRSLGRGLFIAVRAGDDMSFVHSSWQEGIENWRFKLPTETGVGPASAHTIFDRSLLRAGETLHMKHIFRRNTMDGFSIPEKAALPDTILIRHLGSDQSFEMPLVWDSAAIAETTWTIPQDAKLGAYHVTLRRQAEGGQSSTTPAAEEMEDEDGADPRRWTTGRFRVEEFRVPLARAVIQPPAADLINSAQLPLDLSVQYLAGGGAAQLPVRLRAEIGPRHLPLFEGFEEFVFGNGGVQEGTFRRGEPQEGEAPRDRRSVMPPIDTVLDSAGTARAVFSGIPAADRPREVVAEMEFQDPNGEIQTVGARIPVWSSKLLVGIKPEPASTKDGLRFQAAALDLAGRPVAGAAITIAAYERRVFSHRKRLVGGFYAYDHTVEIKRTATLFEGRSDSRGLVDVQGSAPVAGELILVAESRDEAGNRTAAHQSVWVAGERDWWFEAADHDRIDLLPERRRYEPGETARFQVRMPFREATALVSVEREGVMEIWLRTLSGREPVVEVPVKGNYAPNSFVSVLAVRGRTADPRPTALADLGKPAFKLGLAEIAVGWRSHELKVKVAPDRSVYKPRETSLVAITVSTADGQPLPAGSEVALAAVDEGLLELMPNKSWELLPAMMGRRGCEVQTATAQMHVVGKRHFGLKALPEGGGGGGQATRELFDTLLMLKGRLALDAHGQAMAEVPLNDSITAFRIVAVASGGTGFFGSGSAAIRTTQDLMTFSGLPPMVREGDRFHAGLTVRNSSQRPMEVEARAFAPGLAPSGAALGASLAAGEARVLAWETTVPAGLLELAWEFDVASRDGAVRDRLRVAQRVLPAVPVRVVQASLTQLEGKATLAVERPADAMPGGGLRVVLQPRLLDGLSGIADYMRSYRYGCLEQRASVAVALRDKSRWDQLQAQLPAYMDSDGLLKYFPSMPAGDPVLTAYLVAIAHESGWGLPAELGARAAAGLKRFVEGGIVRYSPLPTADLTIRKLAAIEALARIQAAEPRLLTALTIEPNLWPTSAVIDWANILLSLESLPDRRRRVQEALQILRARLTDHGTVMGFSTEASDRLWWLMVSPDVNAVRMLLTALRAEEWQTELPQLLRGALGRQRRGHWDLTTANAWGALALERFAQRFEAEPVSGTTRADLDGLSLLTDWAATPQGGSALLPWPSEKGRLNAEHQGSGRPWLSVQSLAAIALREPVRAGYAIAKTITPVERKLPDRWSRGDIMRVRLDVEAQSDMTWVVVSDPVPAGATILGSGLGRDSQLMRQGEARRGSAWPAFTERSFEALRVYYEFVPKGTWSVEYTLRLNQEGSFGLPPTRVEALYAPESFGEMPNPKIEVSP